MRPEPKDCCNCEYGYWLTKKGQDHPVRFQGVCEWTPPVPQWWVQYLTPKHMREINWAAPFGNCHCWEPKGRLSLDPREALLNAIVEQNMSIKLINGDEYLHCDQCDEEALVPTEKGVSHHEHCLIGKIEKELAG